MNKKPTILILGATGMLGHTVGKYFLDKLDKYNVILTTRDLKLRYGPEKHWRMYDPTGTALGAFTDLHDVLQQTPENPSYLLNCIGTIKPFMDKSPYQSILINSLLPHDLARICEFLGIKMIHITTDCVFSGSKGKYSEESPHDCLDSYGKSKSLGEPKNCMVVRTSIIGPEQHKNASLVAWAQAQAGKEVRGFTNHIWNGVSTKQYAKVCETIIDNDLYSVGTKHVFSNEVDKYELLQLIDKRYGLNLKIAPIEAGEAVNRSMATIHDLCGKLAIPTLAEQIAEM